MATEFLGSSSSSPSRTKPSTPTNSPPPLSQRRQNGTCFHCRNKGHWAANCPFKTPPSQPPSQSPSQKACRFSSSPSPSPSADISFFSPIPCPNCHGSCYVRISGSAKNPDRRYYSCFNWFDEMAVAVESGGGGGSNSKTKRDRSRDGNPECPCGAGNCMVVSEAKGKFFVCPIQKL
ncbi:hypothetical protein TIFTF001_026949 [Ficus carica]|uniref:CCHC-type domain-containing protein n=1 Tax=Ficus carica TaxID=3494 RepID=A0AA88DM45_FICCA|nr:hypothetical protein TIFTF001_026949 [Ficus carica]